MRVRICAVGRMRAGPEADLIDDYLARFDRTGRPLGLGPSDVVEADERKARTVAAQADVLRALIPDRSICVAMDERGKVLSSRQFARKLESWRDTGQDVAFLIGGADGIDPSLRREADFSLSFGSMVWPHMLARVMLAEQLYRSATIMAGAPYHRE
ncbi:MAG: 23S rRNA (pseudouridine(1915)-N(3))-methyltransferase RlmH [Pseudomonadota bacterium]